MMSIFRQALIAHLKDDSAVAAIVGVKVYGYLAPKKAKTPFLVISRLGAESVRNLGGQAGHYDESWQVAAYSATDLVAEDLAQAVIASLDLMQPYTMTPDEGVTTYQVYNSMLDNVGPDIEDWKDDGSNRKTVQKPLTFRILRSIAAS